MGENVKNVAVFLLLTVHALWSLPIHSLLACVHVGQILPAIVPTVEPYACHTTPVTLMVVSMPCLQ